MRDGREREIDHEADPTASDEVLGAVCRACRGSGDLDEDTCPECGGIGWSIYDAGTR